MYLCILTLPRKIEPSTSTTTNNTPSITKDASENAMPGNHTLLACMCIIISVDLASGFSIAKPSSSIASSSPAAASRYVTSLLATKGGGGKKTKRAAQTTKGFGAPPPTLDDVLASFKSRMPEDANDVPCPCGSGDVYADCCGPLHRGERVSPSTIFNRALFSTFAILLYIQFLPSSFHILYLYLTHLLVLSPPLLQ
jgi:hypothetical protein